MTPPYCSGGRTLTVADFIVANEISRNVTVIDGTTAGTVTANEAMSHPTVAISRAFRQTRDVFG